MALYYFRDTGKRICISFDWHNDRHYRYLLAAFAANSSSQIDFEDLTPGEINSDEIARVKGVITSKIRESTHLLAIIGSHANDVHPDTVKIGDQNWQWWEINKAKAEGKSLIGLKIKAENPSPTPILNSGAKWAMSFTVQSILNAING